MAPALLVAVFITFSYFEICTGTARLEIKMLTYNNVGSNSWDRGCEGWFQGACDHRFTFCLDRLPSDQIFSNTTCDLFYEKTGKYQGQTINRFDEDMNGVANPIKLTDLDWKKLGGKVRLKVDVWDVDSGTSDDHVDQIFEDIPPSNQEMGEKMNHKFFGIRPVTSSELDVEINLFCESGYYGPLCDCKPTDGHSGHYKCDGDTGNKICLPGWQNPERNCRTPVNDCLTAYCANGGSCIDGHMGYSCRCAPGYTGRHCQTNINECLSRPCDNGARCMESHVTNGYKCICLPGYTGLHCEDHVCDQTNLCKNGGTCELASGECLCPVGYIGTYCQIYVCDLVTCENNGICKVTSDEHGECICQPGYIGSSCELYLCDIVHCLNNATCDIPTGDCICSIGYEGKICEHSKCDLADCRNGATCGFPTGMCLCAEGFTGNKCKIDLCDSVICENGGICEAISRDCICQPGYIGSSCEMNVCDIVHCLNNATCDIPTGYCICNMGYEGQICEHSKCDLADCKNGASCDFPSGMCLCAEGFTGNKCEVDLCDNITCHGEEGLCQNGQCQCVHGYSGTFCEIKDKLQDWRLAVIIVTCICLLALTLGLAVGLTLRKRKSNMSKDLDVLKIDNMNITQSMGMNVYEQLKFQVGKAKGRAANELDVKALGHLPIKHQTGKASHYHGYATDDTFA